MPLRRIVVGVDFTPGADIAVQRARELGEIQGAELVLVHAGDEVTRLEALRDLLAGAGLAVRHVVRDGAADDALVETAAEVEADLVLTGAREQSHARRWLLGSVAEKVVRAAPCSVLCARGGDPDRGFSRLVVGLDFTEAGERALARAVDVAEADAAIEVVHCATLEPVPDHGQSDALFAELAALRDELTRDAEARAQPLLAPHAAARVRFHFQVRDDDPREALRAVAEDTSADLIVVGGHGKRGVARWLLGSVAESVISDSPCSVLVAR